MRVEFADVFSERGRVVRQQRGDRAATELVYDQRGRLLSTTEGGVRSTQRTYDAQDRLETVTDAVGRVTSVELPGQCDGEE